jgi:hypothetical protein
MIRVLQRGARECGRLLSVARHLLSHRLQKKALAPVGSDTDFEKSFARGVYLHCQAKIFLSGLEALFVAQTLPPKAKG